MGAALARLLHLTGPTPSSSSSATESSSNETTTTTTTDAAVVTDVSTMQLRRLALEERRLRIQNLRLLRTALTLSIIASPSTNAQQNQNQRAASSTSTLWHRICAVFFFLWAASARSTPPSIAAARASHPLRTSTTGLDDDGSKDSLLIRDDGPEDDDDDSSVVDTSDRSHLDPDHDNDIASDNHDDKFSTIKLPTVVILYSWSNVHPDGSQTNPRELFEVIAAGNQLEPWLDIVNIIPAPTEPPRYLDVVEALRGGALVVACISPEFVNDIDCVKEVQFAVNGLDLPVIPVIVGPRNRQHNQHDDDDDDDDDEWIAASPLADIIKASPQKIYAVQGWTDDILDDVSKLACMRLNLATRHPSDMRDLVIASANGDIATILRLLDEERCDPNASDLDGMTPLHSAAANGQLKAVKLLLDRFVDTELHLIGDGTTPLHMAARLLDPSVAQLLLANNADPYARDNNGNTPVHVAASHSLPVLQVLYPHVAAEWPLNNEESTLLHAAAASSTADTVSFLLENNHDPNVTDASLSTPLHIACLCASVNATATLLASGATVNAQTRDGSTPLHLVALSATTPDAITIANLLLSRPGAAADLLDDALMSPLHIAASAGNTPLVRLLIDRGVAVDDPASDGRTPLHLAASAGALDAIETLIEAGASSCPDNDGWTPLHAAAANGHAHVIGTLVSRFAGIEDRDREDRTALAVAGEFGMREVWDVLLAVGADDDGIEFLEHDEDGSGVVEDGEDIDGEQD